MKITSFRPLDQTLSERGLQPFKMEKLEQVVALVGPNGAGKSRVLDALRWHISAVGNPRHKNYLSAKQQLVNLENAIHSTESLPDGHPNRINIPQWNENIQDTKRTIALFDSVQIDHISEQVQLVNFVPKSLNLSDPSTFPPSQLKSYSNTAQQSGVDHLPNAGPSYLQHLQNQWVEVTHQNFQGDAVEVARIIKSYETLTALVSGLLKTDLTRSTDGEVSLFKKPLAQASLSDGQKVLLQLVVALHAQSGTTDQILLLDEPENHLHPGALIQIFDRIRTALPNIQLWIATHSVPLLAHLYADDPSCIWYVQNGVVAFAGKRTEEVLTSLLGDGTQRNHLLHF